MTIENIIELAGKTNLKGAARMGVKTTPYWEFIPIRNYAIPLLHIMIGVFNDVDAYLLDLVDSYIIVRSSEETAILNKYKDIDKVIEEYAQAAYDWQRTEDGKRRSTLVTKRNKQEAQVKNNQEPDDPMSPDELQDYIKLQKKFVDVTKMRDQKKKEKKDYRELLDAYRPG